MNIHEYQAKDILRKFGVATPPGYVAFTPDEAVAAAERLAKETGAKMWVVKSQIHAGGRGKGGGVKLAKDIATVRAEATRMIGMQLITPQTGPAGQKVQKVFITEACDIARELYLGLLVDRASQRVTVMASTEGGVEIEEVAKTHPEKIIKVAIDPLTGLQPFHARDIAFGLGLTGKQVNKCVSFLTAMYKAFTQMDMAIVEINPLVVTTGDDVLALDAKIVFDDNALFRHADVAAMRDEAEEDPAEVEATKAELNYVRLEGNIGCMVNGAGLAMATMDIIKLYGGQPANFLDVGGGATKERVTTAFKIILRDKNVKAILVNIFGGIMRCDIIAEGVIAAAKEVSLSVPLVVRLEGTNVDLGKKILAESGLPILSADNLADAAQKVVGTLKQKAA